MARGYKNALTFKLDLPNSSGLLLLLVLSIFVFRRLYTENMMVYDNVAISTNNTSNTTVTTFATKKKSLCDSVLTVVSFNGCDLFVVVLWFVLFVVEVCCGAVL